MNALASRLSPNGRLALDLAASGLPVFPCKPANKRPFTDHGFKDASADAAAVRRWWSEHPEALVGLPTGAASGLYVVDLDVDRETGEAVGEATWRALGFGELLDAAVTTPSGGRHIYFRDPGPEFRNTAKALGPGIDTRGHGGYVIAPGTTAHGGPYRPPEGVDWREAPAMPDALRTALLAACAGPAEGRGANLPLSTRAAPLPPADADRTRKWAEAGLTAELLRVATAPAGTRNHTLNAAAFALGQIVAGGGLPEEGTRARLIGAGIAAGLPEAEARRTVAGGLGAGMREPRTAPERERAEPAQRQDGRAAPPAPGGPRVLNGAAPPAERTSTFYSAADLAGRAVPPRDWHVPDLVPCRTVTLFSGDGGTGKSLLAHQLAVATTAGSGWLGLPVKRGRAILLSAEDDDDELHRRTDDIRRAVGCGWGDLAGLTLRSLAGEDALLAVESGLALMGSTLLAELEARAAEEAPALVVIDTLADVYPANENDRAKVRQFVGLLRGLAIRQRCAVMLLGHPSLTGLSTGTGASGSTAWNNSVRSRLYLSRIVEGPYEPDPDRRVLRTMKANYGRVGGEIGLTWRAGVFAADAKPAGLDRLAAGAKAERVFLALLDEFTTNGRPVSANPSATYAPTLFSKHPDAEGVAKPAFVTAMNALFARATIAVETHGRASKERSRIVRAGGGDHA